MSLPCITEKCIAYPACISKKRVTCMALRDFYDGIIDENRDLANRTAKAFSIIHQTLPNLVSITSRINTKEKVNHGSMSV